MWQGKCFAAADADAAETNWKHKVTPDWGDLMIQYFITMMFTVAAFFVFCCEKVPTDFTHIVTTLALQLSYIRISQYHLSNHEEYG